MLTRSEWWITGLVGRSRRMAISRAWSASALVIRESACHPTILRVNKSIMLAR
nr:hypothetical protein [Alicyclobacillus shizuokensis]